ncbi:RES family NAD+ phosphorylase (plasmid) [Mesorhizobium sp. AR10]|uniref:RES family NAD+ phosphorylase n=1 Tax=Mesorhizobium sp. AR10 TaxID=2865839 RepID=UPI00215FB5CC|nr:RES family NAD+ phosphorylase [Mesorhizobium sp. AR10]UVK35796.1 RES family NAD+ phosphorylase [Mesorhizobium sp. AR10]
MSGPLPPSDLAKRTPELVTLSAGANVYRFYTARYEPIYFDRSRDGRLNAPDATYGVLYVAKRSEGAFAETFLRSPGRTLIDADLLARKAYVRLQLRSDLLLIRLAGPGLAVLGATAEIVHSGLPYDTSQIWSQALSRHPLNADGIAYNARHDDEELCYALFDRCKDALFEAEKVSELDQEWFWRLAGRYKVGLAPH